MKTYNEFLIHYNHDKLSRFARSNGLGGVKNKSQNLDQSSKDRTNFERSIRHIEIPDKSDELKHWKYVKKIPVGGGYRYFYSWAEYNAFLKDPTADLKRVGSKAKQELNKAKRQAQKQTSKGKKMAKSRVENVRKTTLEAVKKRNGSREPSFKEKMNVLAKKASKKWNGEDFKKRVGSGREWIDYKISGKKQNFKATNPYKFDKVTKQYKYLKRIKANGKYYYFYTQEEIDNYNKVKSYQASEPKFMKDVKESKAPYTSQEDSIMVNPRYNINDYDEKWEYNCAECTAIYELRRRGYDVESNGVSALSYAGLIYNTVERFDEFYKGAKVQKPKPTETDAETYLAIKKEIEKNPPGSRGDLSVTWKEGGGHSVAWERDNNGKIHIIDTQMSGHGGQVEYDLRSMCKEIDNSKKAHKDGDEWGEPPTYIVRTDNLKLKPEIKEIFKETNDKKRKKPSTQSTFTVDWNQVSEGYTSYSSIMPTRSMTQEEVATKYYNLIDQEGA